MIYKDVEAREKPPKVLIERLPEKTTVRLTDNVKTFMSADDEPQEMARYDEVVFDLPEDRKGETKATIEKSFADWWEYGQSDPVDDTVTIEDRVAALEEMYMSMMEG